MSRRILITSAGSGPCNNLMRSLLHGDASTFLIGCNSDRFTLKQSRGQRNFLLPPSDSAFDQALRSVSNVIVTFFVAIPIAIPRSNGIDQRRRARVRVRSSGSEGRMPGGGPEESQGLHIGSRGGLGLE